MIKSIVPSTIVEKLYSTSEYLMSLQDTKVCVNTCKLHANASNRIKCECDAIFYAL